jgi:hypothetical protein
MWAFAWATHRRARRMPSDDFAGRAHDKLLLRGKRRIFRRTCGQATGALSIVLASTGHSAKSSKRMTRLKYTLAKSKSVDGNSFFQGAVFMPQSRMQAADR